MNENKNKLSRRAAYVLATLALVFFGGYVLYTGGVVFS